MTSASTVQLSLSNLNRRLRNICEREGMDYGEDTADEDEIVRRFRIATQLTAKNIRGIMSDIKKAKTVDLCFLIDGTSSMRPHIEGVRDSVTKIINTMVRSQASPNGIEKIRLAMVVYRDFDNPVPMEVCQFTNEAEKCVRFCNKAQAISGMRHDPPEDVFGGLEQAAKLDWSSDAGTRIVFHMGDMPCHGNRYHAATMRDTYPNGDPKGRTSSELFKRFRELDISYYFGKISRQTDQMIDEFCKDYGRFIKTFSVEDVTKIAGSVIASISTSVEENVEKSKLGCSRQARLRDYRLDPCPPDWNSLPVQQGTYLVYELPDTVEDVIDDKPLVEKQIGNVRVKIAPNPFAEGSERLAYYAQDMFVGYVDANGGARRARSVTRRGGRAVSAGRGRALAEPNSASAMPTDIVLKEYKYLGKKQNTLERYKTACEAQTVASYLADQFNSFAGPLGAAPIKFLKTKILLLTSSTGLRIMSCERKFQGNIKFVKFTNNCAYSMQATVDEVSKSGADTGFISAVMAFSHWTYQQTDGFLMIVDLQGCICEDNSTVLKRNSDKSDSKKLNQKVLMTDPAIHCLDVTRFAPLNLGRSGMQAFFDGHQCSQLCRRLGLKKITQVPAAERT